MARQKRNLFRNEQGATAIEYGLIIAMIVLAMFAALTSVAGTTSNMWNMVSTRVQGA